MKNEHLENLSIFELRDLARKIGVFNPTVLKKQDLISAIHDIQSGKTKPHVAKTKQGRPPKSIGMLDKIVNIFLPEDILTTQTKEIASLEKPKQIEFNCELTIPENISQSSVCKGYLEILNSGCGILRRKISVYQEPLDTVYVISKYIDQYKLRNGDEILCHAAYVQDDKPKVLYEITQINGIAPEEFDVDRKNYDDLPFNINTADINFETAEMKRIEDKLKLQYGDTIFCHHSNALDFMSFAYNLIDNEHNAFDNYIYLSPTTTPKGYELLKNSKAELYYCDFNDSYYIQERLSFLAYNRAKRLAEQGKKVCFIVDDLMGVVSIDKGAIDELVKSRKVMSVAKNLGEGSVTTICSFPPISNNNIGNFVLTTFATIENSALFLEGKEVDLERSWRS